MVRMLRADRHNRVLEPAGGDGAFVTALLRSGSVTPKQITVWDLDPAVEQVTRRLGVNFSLRDSLLNPEDSGGSVTHVIGNPPYLSKQSTYIKTHRQQLRKHYAEIGANDTYAMFTYMALRQLCPGGQL